MQIPRIDTVSTLLRCYLNTALAEKSLYHCVTRLRSLSFSLSLSRAFLLVRTTLLSQFQLDAN